MATYNRVKVKIGSIEFRPVEAKYTITRNANQVGRRVGDSLIGRVEVWMDASVLDNLPQSAQIDLWKIATESKDPLHKIEVTWYLDEADKVLHAVEFMGWIAAFEVGNPQADVSGGGVSSVQFKNLLRLELAVVVDESNVSKHKFTK
ncbi:MAG: hypothetical protein KF785_01650 [Gemmatimonadales bacterium]|nr:hypothetical protein [Gemmatimonadales bacterium]